MLESTLHLKRHDAIVERSRHHESANMDGFDVLTISLRHIISGVTTSTLRFIAPAEQLDALLIALAEAEIRLVL